MSTHPSGLTSAQAFDIFCASREFLRTHDPFEEPIAHSEGDHLLELVRVRYPLIRSEVMGGLGYVLEISQPIREFSASARWVISLSYRTIGKGPQSLADGYVTVYREGEPIVSGIDGRGMTLFDQVMRDLS